jgi:hypothetical protein
VSSRGKGAHLEAVFPGGFGLPVNKVDPGQYWCRWKDADHRVVASDVFDVTISDLAGVEGLFLARCLQIAEDIRLSSVVAE